LRDHDGEITLSIARENPFGGLMAERMWPYSVHKVTLLDGGKTANSLYVVEWKDASKQKRANMLVDHIDGLPNLGRCETCGGVIIVYPTGTPRRYCGAVCRNAAKIRRREERKEQANNERVK